MPTFKFTSPDGKTYTVNGPDGATEKQAFQMLQSQMAAPAQKQAPAKPFGQQLSDSIADLPRQAGLTARYGLEGVGDVLDLAATPFRAGLNAILPNKSRGIEDVVKGNSERPAIEGRSGKTLADMLRLPEPTTAQERVVGDATRMVAGAALPIGLGANLATRATGTTQAVGRVLSSNPVQQFASAGASGLASGATRETGGGEVAQAVAGLAAGVATPFAMNKAQSVASAAGRRLVNPAVTQQNIDIQINQALRENGLKLEDLPRALQNSMRADVAAAYKISDQVTPDAVRRLADYRLTGANPTAGPLTLDPAIVTQQKNLAKLGINSKDAVAQTLGRTENANNQVLIGGLNELGAARAGSQIEGGRRVMNALGARDERAAQLITDRYNAARSTTGRSAELDPEFFVNTANAKLNDALLSGKVPSDVRNLLNKEWVDVMRGAGESAAGASPKFTVDMAEQMKTRIAALQRSSTDPAERAALGLVRGSLDETPLMAGQQIGQESIDAFNKARSLNRAYMKIVERTPALEAVRDGVEPDKFVQQFIIGSGGKASVANVESLYGSIKSNPDAVQAVKDQIVAHLKSKALNGANDEVGKISQSTYNKALNSIGDEKLSRFFTKSEVDQLKAIGRVASYEQFQPAGAAVNNSNTAAAGLSAIFDRIANSPLLSKIPLGSALATPAQNISVGIRSGRALDVPQAIAGNRLALPQGFTPSPLIGTTRDDENRNRLAR